MLTNVLLAQLKRPQAALHRRVLASVPAARHYKAISSMNARSITSLPKSSPAESGGPLLKPDPNIALRQRSLSELVTLWAVYRICGSQRLVKAAPSILKTFENLHLSWLSNAVVRRSFFSWFCAGEQEGEIVQTLRRLRDSGMGSLIGFSVEADLSDSPSSTLDPAAQRAQVNVKADMFAKEYINSLVMAAKVPGTMAAIKVTGLVDPQVLYRLSQPYTPMRDAFVKADYDKDGRIDYTQFKQSILPAMPGGDRVSSASNIYSMVDTNSDGLVDWVDIQMALGLDNPLARPLYLRTSESSSYGAAETDIEDYERLISRTRAVVQQAKESSVRLLVDAEHTYFQPIIDHVALVMQREFNAMATQSTRFLVLNTYQMYRTDSYQRMTDDYERAAREGWRFGAKLVRGAYMELERARAQSLGYPSPINPTIEATHANYNRGVRMLMNEISIAQKAGKVPPALFVASHNADTVERVLQQLREFDIDMAGEPVMFGQLLGMQDAVSYALAKDSLPIYKYVPYGPLEEVIPFLIRRAQENSAISSSICSEGSLVMAEIRRRVSGRTDNPLAESRSPPL